MRKTPILKTISFIQFTRLDHRVRRHGQTPYLLRLHVPVLKVLLSARYSYSDCVNMYFSLKGRPFFIIVSNVQNLL